MTPRRMVIGAAVYCNIIQMVMFAATPGFSQGNN
jgi:hypothetical protein